MTTELVVAAFSAAAQALQRLASDEDAVDATVDAARLLATTIAMGGTILSCGNGGSMCDAMHFAEELTGRFRDSRPPIAAIAISDAAHLTCTANDFGFDDVFARYVTAVGRPGDALLAISTSGTSGNVVKAVTAARDHGLATVGLTGRIASPLVDLCDISVVTPSTSAYADRVQEQHIVVLHTIVELIEALAPAWTVNREARLGR